MTARLPLVALLAACLAQAVPAQDSKPDAKPATAPPEKKDGKREATKPGDPSTPSAQRTADLKKTIERRDARRRQMKGSAARQKEAIRLNQEEARRNRENYEIELARLRAAEMTEAARRQAIAGLEQRRLEWANNQAFLGGGTAPIATGTTVTVTGRITRGFMAIGAETTGTTLAATDGLVYELDLSAAAESPQALDRLNGATVTVSGVVRVRPGVEVAQRRILSVARFSQAAAGPTLSPPRVDPQPRPPDVPTRVRTPREPAVPQTNPLPSTRGSQGGVKP